MTTNPSRESVITKLMKQGRNRDEAEALMDIMVSAINRNYFGGPTLSKDEIADRARRLGWLS